MKNVALIIIDVQKGFDDPSWGNRNNPDAEAKIELLLSEWRKNKRPIIHVQHCSLEPNSLLRSDGPGYEFKDEARPIAGEKRFIKTVNSAFIGTDLEEYLRGNEIESLVVVGLTTDHCVSTTTRMAGNLGFEVRLVSDATATFDRRGDDGTQFLASDIHNIHLASLNDEFCAVRSAEQVLSEFE
jgi:nicotinamidase-related amidase